MKKLFSFLLALSWAVTTWAANPPFTPDTLQGNDYVIIARQNPTSGAWQFLQIPGSGLGGNTNALTGAQQAILNFAFTNQSQQTILSTAISGGLLSGNGGAQTNITATFLDTTGTAYVNTLITTALAANASISATFSNGVLSVLVNPTYNAVRFPLPVQSSYSNHTAVLSDNALGIDGFSLTSLDTNALYGETISTISGAGATANKILYATNLTIGGWSVVQQGLPVGNGYNRIALSNGVYFLVNQLGAVGGPTNGTLTGLWGWDGNGPISNYFTYYQEAHPQVVGISHLAIPNSASGLGFLNITFQSAGVVFPAGLPVNSNAPAFNLPCKVNGLGPYYIQLYQ